VTVSTPAASGISNSVTILLVEDEKSVREMLRDFLSSEGYDMMVAEDGVEALKICGCHGEPIHLVLTDVSMPNMSGRELGDQIAKRFPQTRVLYMSGHTVDSMTEHTYGQTIYLIGKPFTLVALHAKIREVLGTQQPSANSPNSNAGNISGTSSSASASSGR